MLMALASLCDAWLVCNALHESCTRSCSGRPWQMQCGDCILHASSQAASLHSSLCNSALRRACVTRTCDEVLAC